MGSFSSRRVAAGCGIAAPVLVLSAILLSTALADPFTWSGHALSDLGRPGTATFPLFNGGLVLGGVVGAPFVGRLWAEAWTPLERAGVVCYGLAIAGMALVGVFFLEHTDWYLGRSLHGPVALAFFAGAPVANLLLGAGAVRAGERRWGAVTVGVGLAHLLLWGGWLLAIDVGLLESGAWFGLVEFLAAVLFGGWTAVAAVRLLDRS
ncbi:DUF998 domain-containing protein [Saliphagus infecundisoli]|uniref:DUF998 domain-containing protein n=1 Tax=Saliphagus infecundisoli TaxID=1849069 RepID=A0ABD5QG26_9EURY|nr:DUF998 domain-containing protein [Saliphagus infecundisoli]